MRMSELDRLKNAFVTALGISPGSDFAALEYAQTEGWDSVAHMQLVAALEAAYGIMIDTDDVIAMSDYSEIRRILGRSYGVELAT